MTCSGQTRLVSSLLWIVAALNVLVTLSVTSGEETPPQPVMYVTGCLGSNSVMLHKATSADDVRAVFVYKGGEILGSDIIPAQGEYKGRLQISRQGDVTLSDLRLWDSGVFRIEMTTRDVKTSTYVVLVVPEAPTAAQNQLHIQKRKSPSYHDHVRLTCGTFTSLGYPAASVLWLDPEGRLLSSSGYVNGEYVLDIPHSSPAGNYSCLLHCSQPHTCCLPPASSLLRHAFVHVDKAAPTPAAMPELTSTLQKTGADIAVGMAALVSDQMQDSFETNREELQLWKEEMEEKMEKKFIEMSDQVEKMLGRKLKQAEDGLGSSNPLRAGGYDNNVNVIDANARRVLETDVYNKLKSNLQVIYQQIDEGRKNMSNFQRKINHKMGSFQKKLRALKQNMKKHGIYKHDRMIENLKNSMKDEFKEINEKFRDIEANDQPSDGAMQNFQQKLNELINRLSQGETNLGSFQRSLTHKVEDLRDTVETLEVRFRKLEHKPTTSRPRSDDNEESDEVTNDTKTVVGRADRPSRPGVSHKSDYPYGERRPPRTSYGDEESDSSKIPVSENCVNTKKKGGTVSGAYTLRPDGLDPQSLWCDMETDGGGWIVFQRRCDGSEEFYRPWEDYVAGFGDPGSNGEFWLGLDKLHLITSGRPHSLRVDMKTFAGKEGYANYQHFRVLSSHQKYLMNVFGYTGTAGDGLIVHDSKPFSTWNEDNDEWADGHCAANYRSAWWYAGCRICDLNAPYTSGPDGIMWLYGDDSWGAGKISFVEMKIRPEQ